MINVKRARNGADKGFVSASHGPRRPRTPGTDLVRVARMSPDGVPLTWADATPIARARFGGEPVPYVACARWYAFELPRRKETGTP